MAGRSTSFLRTRFVVMAWAIVCAGCCGVLRGAERPIALHPDNPHYLLWRGRPTILVTSTEHYGAVLNLDFDYVPYLDELKRHGLNLTRTFSGVYCEAPGDFGIQGNPLAPRAGRLICPFARSDQDGYAGGGKRFDLARWDDAYFARLKDFIGAAGQRGIVVELVLFCPFYRDTMWNLSPMKASNNIQGIGRVGREEVYTLRHADLQGVQEAFVRKVVAELRTFDNLYYEICNEPYFGGVRLEWQHRIADVIVEAERDFEHKHLIAQNIANGSRRVERPHPAVSIFNFHYATPPKAVAENDHLNKVIADDETGFKGSDDFVYRAEGWDFLVAGGAIYDNLDYSFTPDHEDGSAEPKAPGGGGATLRSQLAVLKRFIERFDFVRMRGDDAAIVGRLPENVTARALVERGKQYAVYVRGAGLAKLVVDLPEGKYAVEWLDPVSGDSPSRETFEHSGGPRELNVPRYAQDVALRIVRR